MVQLTNSAGTYFVVQGDVDGDRLADFAITVFGAATLGADDFLL